MGLFPESRTRFSIRGRQVSADGATSADRKASFYDGEFSILNHHPFADFVSLAAGVPGNFQISRLIGTMDHNPPVFQKPFLHC
jgi:hypothetical protein